MVIFVARWNLFVTRWNYPTILWPHGWGEQIWLDEIAMWPNRNTQTIYDRMELSLDYLWPNWIFVAEWNKLPNFVTEWEFSRRTQSYSPNTILIAKGTDNLLVTSHTSEDLLCGTTGCTALIMWSRVLYCYYRFCSVLYLAMHFVSLVNILYFVPW